MLTKPKVRKNRTVCQLCKDKREPYFKEVALLSGYITERGKIVPKERSGVCSTHQRQLTLEIKRARHLSLLPFVS
ncbi:MAG: 30S ribosomal protein S18 [Patescibacteria group bacterium]